MSLREELEKAIAAQWEPDAGDDAANWLIRDQGQALLEALVDADRYREFCRQIDETKPSDIEWSSIERIIIDGLHLGSGAIDAHLDNSLYLTTERDTSRSGWERAITINIESLKEMLIPFEIAHNVCGPDTEYARGYGDCCGDIVHSVNQAIDTARSKTVDGGSV